MKNSKNIFPEINTDEEYEKFKLNNSEQIKKVALEKKEGIKYVLYAALIYL